MAEKGYFLDRGHISSTRLNFQHYQWKEALGYNLSPAVPRNKESIHVADVGTGTGIWLCDVQADLPKSAILQGFDVSPEQFTPARHLPANISLHMLDATAEVPKDLQQKFDVVHVRLLQAAISDDDPSLFIAHCKALLKPGGMLQWDEYDLLAQEPSSVEGTPMPHLERLAAMSRSTRPCSWIGALPATLKQSGFQIVKLDRPRERVWQRQMMMETWCMVAEELAAHLDKVEPSGQQAAAVRQLVQGALVEIRAGAVVSQTFQVVVAQLEDA